MITRVLHVCLLAAGCLTSTTSFAIAEEVFAIADVNLITVNPESIAQWVFQNQSSAEEARKKLEVSLQLQIDVVKLAGELTPDQQEKLELAGRGDISRFFDAFEYMKRTSRTGQLTQEQYNKLWQRIQPLSQRYSAGLFGTKSLFARTVQTALSGEQLEKYEELRSERDRRRYKAVLKATIMSFDSQLPLTEKQRTDLLELVLAKTDPAPQQGPHYYQFYGALHRISEVPQDDLRKIFADEREWKLFSRMLDQAGAMGGMNRQWEESEIDELVLQP